MAIFTIDGIIAGAQAPKEYYKIGTATVAGKYYSPAYAQGMPGISTSAATGVAGASLSGYSGAIPFINPTGTTSAYLARFTANVTVAGSLILYDRLWHNSGINVTLNTAQVINSVAWPARDNNFAISGEGVYIGVEVVSNLGAGTPTWTLGYTNSSGQTRSATTAAITASMVIGSFIPIPLVSGDTGVQSIQNFTSSATMTSGSLSLVAYRPLARLDLTLANTGAGIDSISSGFPKLAANTTPFVLWLPSTVTAPVISAQFIQTNG